MKGSLVLLVFLSIVACNSQQSTKVANTPKTISLHWHQLLSNNQFAEAKKWSTDNAKEWLDWIEQRIPAEELTETNPPLYIEGDCFENGDKATCIYLMEDNGELYQDSFFLVKISGLWLVDLPEEDVIEGETIEELFNDLNKMIEEEEAKKKK